MRHKIIADTAITIDLHNGYSILAMSRWNREKELYTTTFYIKDNDIDRFDLIDTPTTVEFNAANRRDLYLEIMKYIENTDFSYYINRTKYELKCFERGNALYERERLNAK
jgi:hypothetical protein